MADLFDGVADLTLARRTDPATSHAAADRVTAGGARARNLDLVEALVREYPGSTAVELWEAQGLAGELERHEVSRRLSDLRNLGRVRQGEARACRVRRTSMVTWWPANAVARPDLAREGAA